MTHCSQGAPEQRYQVVSLQCQRQDVAILTVAPAGSEKLLYQAGQYIRLTLPDGTQRSYSMATAVKNDGHLEFHIRLRPGGAFLNFMCAHDATCSTLLIDGPYGNFTWSEIPSNLKTVIFLATGTGVAPIRALIEEALNTGCTADLWLYWGGSSLEDLYLLDEFRFLSLSIKNFHFIPLVSDRRDYSAASYIHQVASSQHHQLLDTRIYACGHPEMVAAAKVLFIKERSFPVSNFYADSFNPASVVREKIPTNLSQNFSNKTSISICLQKKAVQHNLVVRPEGSLLAVLQAAGLLTGICGGQQSCGCCRVTVDPGWFSALPNSSNAESRLLHSLGDSSPTDRLACQINLDLNLDGFQISTR